MAHRCEISNKCRQTGNRVSHANNKRKHVFRANIQTKRFFVRETGTFVRLKVSTKMIKTIDKLGLQATLKKFHKTLIHPE
jgi:large subunit ribosomal protein L28